MEPLGWAGPLSPPGIMQIPACSKYVVTSYEDARLIDSRFILLRTSLGAMEYDEKSWVVNYNVRTKYNDLCSLSSLFRCL